MFARHVFLPLFMALTILATAARGGDETLRYNLSKAKYCITAELVADAIRDEERGGGPVIERFQVDVREVIAGQLEEPRISVARERQAPAMHADEPSLRRGDRRLLFLAEPVTQFDETGSPIGRLFHAVDPWFGVLPESESMLDALARLSGTTRRAVRVAPAGQPPPGQPRAADHFSGLEGTWLLTLPAGFEYEALFEPAREAGIYRLRCAAVNLSGLYGLEPQRLVVKAPQNHQMGGLAWKFQNRNVLILTEQPEPSPVGADYRGATLSRFARGPAREVTPDRPGQARKLIGRRPTDSEGRP
jgi:hypothetical protein